MIGAPCAAALGSPAAASELVDGVGIAIAEQADALRSCGFDWHAERLTFLLADVLDAGDTLRGES